jgi:gluconokinase
MKITPAGGAEIDPDELHAILCRIIDEAINRAGNLAPEICSVGFCTFWHSLLGIDGDKKAVTPLYNWSDTRSRKDADELSARVGAEWIHQRTGARPHASYYPAKILWLRRTDPVLFKSVARWVSFGEYFYLKLFGRLLASISMASGTGLLNIDSCDWDDEMLKHVGISRDNLSPIATDDEMLTGLEPEYGRRWPALARIPWMLAAGDGATNNIGSGCVTKNEAALMVGTSGAMRVCWKAERVRIPRGLWLYRANRQYSVMGGALSNGGNAYDWCLKTLQLESATGGRREHALEDKLAQMKADAHGLTVLPFFSGERSTRWADYARAAIVGMSLDTTPLEILRATLEAISYRFAEIYEQLFAEITSINRIIASGGALLSSGVWMQMMSDVMGATVVASAVGEASSRGAAILALHSLGYIRDLNDLPATFGKVCEPDRRNHDLYNRGRRRQQALYERLIAPGPGALEKTD